MKTERRHELATNDLADWLGDKIEELKPYSAAIWGTVLAAIAVLFAVIYWSRKSEARLEQTWDSYFSARSEQTPDGLKSVAEAYPKAAAGLWARLSLADAKLTSGVNDLFEDREASQKALNEAVEAYEFVIDNGPRDSLLAERATFGLGESYESLNELDKARAQYEKVEKNWPGGAFSTQAKQRLADLDKPTTKEFYDWFAKQEPRKKPAANSGLTSGKLPFDAGKLEEKPFGSQLDLKSFGSDKKKGAREDEPTGKSAAKEGSDQSDAEATRDKPLEKKSDDEQPSEEAK